MLLVNNNDSRHIRLKSSPWTHALSKQSSQREEYFLVSAKPIDKFHQWLFEFVPRQMPNQKSKIGMD